MRLTSIERTEKGTRYPQLCFKRTTRAQGAYSNIPSMARRFLGINGQDPSVSKSNRLHVVILWTFFVILKCIP